MHFIPFGPKHKVNEVLSLADFAWISFAALPVLKTNSPNKFFDALAAGKPVLVNHKGWVYDLVKEHNIGVPVLPKELDKALKTLTHLEENPAEIQKMGEKSRKLAEAFFNKEEAIKALLRVFEK